MNGIERALAAPGVVGGDSYLVAGETIRPARVDGDRRGYVIAIGETPRRGARAGRRRRGADRGGGRSERIRASGDRGARGYDRIADTFADWRERIEGDPRPGVGRGSRRAARAGRARARARLRRRQRGDGAARASASALTGVDVSGEQIRRARDERTRRPSSSRRTCSSWSCPPQSFDAECSFYVFNHVPRERLGELLGRIAGWLRPGGLALNAFGASDHPRLDGRVARRRDVLRRLRARRRTPGWSRRPGLTILRDEVVDVRRAGGAGRVPLDPGAAMSCAFDLEHYRELLAAAQAGGYRFAFFDSDASARRPPAPPRRRPVARGGARDGRAGSRAGGAGDVLPDDAQRVLQPRSRRPATPRSSGCGGSATASGCTPSIRTPSTTLASTPCSRGTTPTRTT